MSSHPIMSLLALLLCTVCCADLVSSYNDDWVDMTDMLRYDPMTKTMRDSNIYSSKLIKSKSSTVDAEDSDSKVYQKSCPRKPFLTTAVSTSVSVDLQSSVQYERDKLKYIDASSKGKHASDEQCESDFIVRHVRRLLRLLNVASGSNLKDLSWDVRISLTKEDVDVLRLYAESKGSLQNVDRVLTNIVNGIEVERPRNWMDEFKDKRFMDEWMEYVQQNALFACFVLWLLLVMFMNTSRALAVCLKMVIGLIALSIFWEWKALYQKAKALQRSNQSKFTGIPIECTPESMTFWQYIRSFSGKGDRCHQYYLATTTDSFWKVSPFEAATTVLAKMFPVFGENIGEGLGQLFSKFMDEFGYFERYFMVLLLTVVIVATSSVVILFLANGLIRLPQSNPPLYRPMVEEVTNHVVSGQVKAAAAPPSSSTLVIEKHFYHHHQADKSGNKSTDIADDSSSGSQAVPPQNLPTLMCPRCESSCETSQTVPG